MKKIGIKFKLKFINHLTYRNIYEFQIQILFLMNNVKKKLILEL